MSSGGPTLSVRDAEKLAAREPVCRHCYHWLSLHHVLQPVGAEETHAAVLACTEHSEAFMGETHFCDCVIDLEVDPGV